MTSLTLSPSTDLMIFQLSFWPRASDSANLNACSELAFPGSGGSLGSTTAWITAGPRCASASRKIERACSGSSIVYPAAPQLFAIPAKSIGCSSTPY